MAKLASLTRTASKWLAPEGFGTLSGNVLLYAPSAIRAATSIFLVIGVVFSIPYMLDHQGDLRLVLTRVFVVLLAALATLLTFVFAAKYYKILVLATAFSGITVTLFAVTFMDGPNINPHAALLVVYMVGAGFCLGRRGVMITLAWLILNYALIIAVSSWDIWPNPTSISVAKVQYENASAMFFLLLVLIPLLLGYLALVEKSIGELKGSHAEQQRLLQRLIAVQEGERERIAHVLHEGAIQDLAALRLAVLNEQSANDVIPMIDSVLKQLRTVSSDLHPAILNIYGLPAALEQLVDQQEQGRAIKIQMSSPQLDHLNPQVGIVLFRIAQEALTNVRKHSKAKHAWISLEQANNSLILEVRDDGQGFDVESMLRQAVQTGHFGLTTLHELALSVGGDLHIRSQPRQGTTIVISVPHMLAYVP